MLSNKNNLPRHVFPSVDKEYPLSQLQYGIFSELIVHNCEQFKLLQLLI